MGQPYPARCAEGPASRAEGNTRAQKYETVKLYLIGEEITKHSPSDGEPLTGSQAREGIAVQGSHSFARLSGAGTAIPISRPAGQRNAQNEGSAFGLRNVQWEGESLFTDRLAAHPDGPSTSRDASVHATARDPCHCISDTCIYPSEPQDGGA